MRDVTTVTPWQRNLEDTMRRYDVHTVIIHDAKLRCAYGNYTRILRFCIYIMNYTPCTACFRIQSFQSVVFLEKVFVVWTMKYLFVEVAQ